MIPIGVYLRGIRLCVVALLLSLCGSSARAQSFPWRIEAESPQTRVLLRADTLDIVSPQGLSLWWAEPLVAPCVITYRACVVVADGPFDRLSDLNCFWMASMPLKSPTAHPLPLPEEGNPSEPKAPNTIELPSPWGAWEGAFPMGGRFAESYRLQCYYLGFGGNHNTTTRFRRYTADTLGVTDATHRPPILREYTDQAHLLRPNHWYSIRIEVLADGCTRYYIDDELLVDYCDPEPLRRGWFAFRTTWSHTRLTGFSVRQL